jgi:glutamine---fructose-6-phosphate transaminase (isomerizing)
VSALRETIGRQADALHEVAELDVALAVERLRDAPRVAVVGTGTSLHAAELAAALLAHGGRPARAVSASRYARWEPRDPEEAVILVSHTGETAFARAVRQRRLAEEGPIVSVTGPHVEWPEAIRTPVRERSETYTVSYTAALGVLGLIAHGLTGIASGPEQLREAAVEVARVALAPGIEHVPMPARALAVCGAGPWAVTAREAALKLREGARILCEAFDPERLLHGAAVPYGPADGLLLIEPAADPDGLVGAVGEAARAQGIAVSELHEPAAGLLNPYTAQIPMTVRAQCLAARFAELRGTDPDVAITGAWSQPALWERGAPWSEPDPAVGEPVDD